MPVTGSYSIGKSARNLVGRSHVYRYDWYRNSRHSGAISLSMVCGSIVPAQGRFRRQIGTESCYRVGSQAYQRGVLSVQVRMRIGTRAAGLWGAANAAGC
jgi:hypothetical protein